MVLIGALGGAALTGAATIYAAVGVQRRHARERQLEREREANLIEREIVLRRRSAQLDRLIGMRTTGRAWLDTLERATQDLAMGREIDLRLFDREVRESSQAMAGVAYGLAAEGVWVCTDSSQEHRNRERDVGDATSDARGLVIDRLRSATLLIRAEIDRPSTEPTKVIDPRVEVALESVRSARAHLNSTLLSEIQNLNEDAAPMRESGSE